MRITVCLLLAGVAALAGCEKALFIEQESRTPYDRYLALRGRQQAMTKQNSQGGKSAALRERLQPLDTP